MQNMSSRDNVNKIFTKYNSSSLQTCPSNHLTSLKGDIKYFIDMRGCEKPSTNIKCNIIDDQNGSEK